MDSSSRMVLSGPVKAGLAVMATVLVLAEIYFFRQDGGAMLIIVVGTLLVVMLLVAYGMFLRWSQRKRSAPLEKGVLANTAASPYRISEPARRAAADELRKKFEGGLSKFRAAGKDLYSLPWYVIVGEPGGGKTEAIRHCSVGFPPGLQDYTQGAGGTLNMNWWFTNHAIILDTAGRMMFEEVVPGTTNEWEQFLRLLVKTRPNCPVNGMLLVIPADSLIRDSADAIEQKAQKIAQQLDQIQRILGVRFPVFVVVTKCDLINGFREFFDDLTDPQLQHQVLGWSNPSPLDEAFNPELVDQHLRTVRERLLRRRQALLLDPVHTEDPSGKRVEQVDALYAFPDAFLKIAPRLRRYLEMIFVAGEWSPKPLFLRGIYFTSSMREGTALDAELADALQVPVESLRDDGRSWERERAYFLRDLFMMKVFREKGLVTRASNTKRVQQRRKLVVMTLAMVGLVTLLVLTWTGAKQLDENIGQQTRYWMAVNANWKDRRADWSIVLPNGADGAYRYNGDSEISLGETRTNLGDFFTDASQRAQDRISVPWVFRAQVMFQGDLNDQRRRAYRHLYEASMLAPVIEAARGKLRAIAAAGDSTPTWSPDATDALAELVRLELSAGGVAPAPRPDQPLLNLDPMMRFILSEDEYASFKSEHRKAAQDALEWMYGSDPTTAQDWPPPTLAAGTPSAQNVLDDGAKALERYWTARVGGQNPRMVDIRAVRTAVDQFAKAEEAVVAAAKNGAPPAGPVTVVEYDGLRQSYLAKLGTLTAARAAVDAAVAKLEQSVPAGQSLLAMYEIEVDRDIESALRTHEKVIQQMPKTSASGGGAIKLPDRLATLRQKLADSAARIPKLRTVALPEDLLNDLARIDRQYLTRFKGLDGKERRQYQVHAQVFEEAGRQLNPTKPSTAPSLETFKTAAEGVDRLSEELGTRIAALPADGAGGERLRQVCALGKGLTDWAARRQRYDLVDAALSAAPADAAAFAARVRTAMPGGAPVKYPVIFIAKQQGGDAVASEYRPQAARAVLTSWVALGTYLAPPVQPAAGERVLERQKLLKRYDATRKAARDYGAAYCTYWNEQVPARVKISVERWNDFFLDGEKRPRAWKAWEANAALKELIKLAATALGDLEEAVPAWKDELQTAKKREGYQGTLSRLDESLFQNECDKILRNWRGLARDAKYDPLAARELVLAMKPDAWKDQFVFSGSSDGIAVQYWSDLAYELTRALRVAADSGQLALGKAVDALRRYDRFPLGPLGAGRTPLSRDEVAEARKLRDRIVAMRRAVSSAGGAVIASSSSSGAAGGKIDEELNLLRGSDVSEQDGRWVDRVGKILDALPADGQLQVAIWVAADDQRSRLARARKPDWYSVILQQRGGDPGPEVQIFPAREDRPQLGVVRCPAGSIQFAFFRNPGAGRNKPPTALPEVPGGEWQALGLLHQRRAFPLPESNGRRWYLDLPMPQGDTVLGLVLEFDREIPRLEEWPVAPDKAAPQASPGGVQRPAPGNR